MKVDCLIHSARQLATCAGTKEAEARRGDAGFGTDRGWGGGD